MSMNVVDLFRDLWEKEHLLTVALFGAIPDDRLGYEPWAGARRLADLAVHIVDSQLHTLRGVLAGELVAFTRSQPPEIRSTAELVAFCKAQHEALRPLVAQLDEPVLAREVPFKLPDGRVAFVRTGREILFIHVLHHQVHHRAQLQAYLRVIGAPVPGIYGPTREQTPPLP